MNCHRRECTRTHSAFRIFLSRKRPPRLDLQEYCSETCLQNQLENELQERWRLLQRDKNRLIPRPRLGTILLETASITPEQLDAAIRLQRTTHQGRLGECLLRLGFVEEQQITMALSRQFGIPVIHLRNAVARIEAARMIPGPVAKCSNLVPVGYVDDQSALRIAVCGPVNFGSQEAIRRMLRKGVMAYIGDESAIQSLLEKLYRPEELDLSRVPGYASLSDLLDIARGVVRYAMSRRAENVQFELMGEYFWARLDCEDKTHHQVYCYQGSAQCSEERIPARPWSLASVPAH